MFVHQIRSTDGTGTLSYLVATDDVTVGVIIDPNLNDADVMAADLKRRNITITHVIDTHTHADHLSGAAVLRERLGAKTVMHLRTKEKWKIVEEADKFGIGDTVRANVNIPIDVYVEEGDTIPLGEEVIRVLHTPGHTDNNITLQIGDAIFPGDLILVGQAGRSDLPGGNAEDQYDTILKKILPLPDNTKIYPGHDYEDHVFVLLGDERRTNPFLQQQSKGEYVAFVKDFFPPIAESGPGGHMTLQCGAARVLTGNEPFKAMSVAELGAKITAREEVTMIDVRESMELIVSGVIPGAVNIPLRELTARRSELPTNTDQVVVAICQNGNRSQEAAHFLATQCGCTNVYNLTEGTTGWVRSGRRVKRNVPISAR